MPINPRPFSDDPQVFKDKVFDLLRSSEGTSSALPYEGVIHNDGIGVPTVGYGYAMVIKGYDAQSNSTVWKVKSELEQDFQQLGITITEDNDQVLNSIANTLNNGNQTQAIQLITELDNNVANLTEAQARDLADIETDRAMGSVKARFIKYLGQETGNDLYNHLQGSQEMLALTHMSYNSPSTIGPNLTNALNDGNRAKAWYEIRYNTNPDSPVQDGLAKRRYLESEIIGLRDGSANQMEMDEAMNIYQTFTNHREHILAYEDRFSIQVNKANNDYDFNQIEVIDRVQNLKDSLEPAYEKIQSIYLNNSTDTVDYRDIQMGNIQQNTLTGTQRNQFELGEGDHQSELLIGQSGNDTLHGKGGNDVLVGGDGVDTYQFSGTFGQDRVIDTDGQIDIDGFHLQGSAQYQPNTQNYHLTVQNQAGETAEFRIEQINQDVQISRVSEGDNPANTVLLRNVELNDQTAKFGITVDQVVETTSDVNTKSNLTPFQAQFMTECEADDIVMDAESAAIFEKIIQEEQHEMHADLALKKNHYIETG